MLIFTTLLPILLKYTDTVFVMVSQAQKPIDRFLCLKTNV